MTDEERRAEDKAHVELAEKVDRVATDLEVHVHPELESVVTALNGPIIDEVLDIRDYEQGLVAKMDHLVDKSNNGGWVATLAAEDRVFITQSNQDQRTKILVALIGAVAVIMAALVTSAVVIVQMGA